MTITLIFSRTQASSLKKSVKNPCKLGFFTAISEEGGPTYYTDKQNTGEFPDAVQVAKVSELRCVRDANGNYLNQDKWLEWKFPGFES